MIKPEYMAYALKAMQEELKTLDDKREKLVDEITTLQAQLEDAPPPSAVAAQMSRRSATPAFDISEFETTDRPTTPKKRQRQFSDEARQKLSEGMKKRWNAAKARGETLRKS